MREVNLRHRRSVVSHVGSVGSAYSGVLSALCARARRSAVRIHTALVDGDRQRAEDVVHETLLRAWQHPAALHPYRGNPRPRLFTVAHHLVIDERRARRTSPAVPTFTRLRHSWYGVSRPPVMPTAGEGARRAQLHPPTA
jgi:DNA-directed RNA polymerase specialized sigma24 family protein